METEHCGFFHSMIGVEGVLEYLLILMCWKEPQTFRQKLIERDKVLDEYRPVSYTHLKPSGFGHRGPDDGTGYKGSEETAGQQ